MNKQMVISAMFVIGFANAQSSVLAQKPSDLRSVATAVDGRVNACAITLDGVGLVGTEKGTVFRVKFSEDKCDLLVSIKDASVISLEIVNGSHFLACCKTGVIHRIAYDRRIVLPSFDVGCPVFASSLSGDKSTLALNCSGHGIRFLDLASNRENRQAVRHSAGAITGIALAEKGDLLMLTDHKQTMIGFSKMPSTNIAERNIGQSVVFLDDRRVLVGSRECKYSLYDIVDKVRRPIFDWDEDVNFGSTSPSGLVHGSSDSGRIFVVDPKKNKLIVNDTDSFAGYSFTAISQDGTNLFAVTPTGQALFLPIRSK